MPYRYANFKTPRKRSRPADSLKVLQTALCRLILSSRIYFSFLTTTSRVPKQFTAFHDKRTKTSVSVTVN